MSRKMFFILAVILVHLVIIGSVMAQGKYPERPIEVIVGYAAGSSTDAAARVMAEFLKKYLGQPVVVVNKPGGAGAIGGNDLFKSKPDGYTLGVFNSSQLTPELQMNPDRFVYKSGDIKGVAQWAFNVPAILTKYDSPWKSLVDFVEAAKKNPNTIRWGHPGRGNNMWIIGSLIIQQAGIKVLDVPFESDAQLMAALLGNHIDISVSIVGAAPIAQMEAKKIKPLCLALEKRVDLVPNTPTAEELGYPLKLAELYLGTFVPKGTPKEIVAKLSSTTKKVGEDPEFKEKLRKVGYPVVYRDTEEFEVLVEKFGRIKWDLLKKLGVL